MRHMQQVWQDREMWSRGKVGYKDASASKKKIRKLHWQKKKFQDIEYRLMIANRDNPFLASSDSCVSKSKRPVDAGQYCKCCLVRKEKRFVVEKQGLPLKVHIFKLFFFIFITWEDKILFPITKKKQKPGGFNGKPFSVLDQLSNQPLLFLKQPSLRPSHLHGQASGGKNHIPQADRRIFFVVIRRIPAGYPAS